MEDKQIQINGINLHYRVAGQGEPLLLMHGWTQTSEFWAPYAEQLSRSYRVYLVDLRGHGKSSALDEGFSIQKAAGDILEMVGQLGLHQARAIGLSYGGLILLECLQRNPGLFRDVVLIGTSYQYDGREQQKGKPVFRFDDLDAGFRQQLMQQHTGGESQVRALFNPELDYRIHLREEQLQAIKSRVLLMQGDQDHLTGIDQVFRMRKLIPSSTLWIVPGGGHLPFNQVTTEEFVRVVTDFFKPTS